jgi:hypothetical protein
MMGDVEHRSSAALRARVSRDSPAENAGVRCEATQDRCAQTFTAAGLDVSRQDYGSGVNVLGELRGTVGEVEPVLIKVLADLGKKAAERHQLPYDESRYLIALQKRHAPLLKFAAQNSP